MTPEAQQLRQILTQLVERLENTVTWARLALSMSERTPDDRSPEGGTGR